MFVFHSYAIFFLKMDMYSDPMSVHVVQLLINAWSGMAVQLIKFSEVMDKCLYNGQIAQSGAV